MQDNPFLTPNESFQMFSLEHGLTLLFFTVFAVVLIRWAQAQSKTLQDRVGEWLAYGIAATLIIWIGLQFYTGDFVLQEDFPLHLCNLMALLIVFLARSKKYWLYEIFFFWAMVGTVQALITPALIDSFPHYHYFKFWIVHAGVVIYMWYVTLVQGMRPTLKSVFKSFLALQVYALFTFLVNQQISSNFFFLNGKPPHPSLLDKFGDWPMYILVIECALIPIFLIFYAPFVLADRFKQKNI